MTSNNRLLNTLALTLAAWLSVPALLHADGTLLFDGQTLNGWMKTSGQPVEAGWEVVDGTIHLRSGTRPGDIVTEKEYGDFDLRFDWKIAKGGNNGIKYRVRKYGGRTLGCEYQIIDDESIGGGTYSDQSTGALYDVYEPNGEKYLNPPGEFNHSRILVLDNHIEHWLNGHLLLSAEVGSSEWFARIAKSKFADVEGFGQNRVGRIMLTDHGSEVWYRNLVLRELTTVPDRIVYCPPVVVRYSRTCTVQRSCFVRHRWRARRTFLRRW